MRQQEPYQAKPTRLYPRAVPRPVDRERLRALLTVAVNAEVA